MTNTNATPAFEPFTLKDFLAENIAVSAKIGSDPVMELLTIMADGIENDFTRINLVRTIAFEAKRTAEQTITKLNACIEKEIKKAPRYTNIDNFSELADCMNAHADNINAEDRGGRTFEEVRNFWERSVLESVNMLRCAWKLHDQLAAQFENGRSFMQELAARENYKRERQQDQEIINNHYADKMPKVTAEDRKRIVLDGLARFRK